MTARRVTTRFSTASKSAVYFVRPRAAPGVCAAGQPLSVRSVEVRKLADSAAVFAVSAWSGVPVHRFLDVDRGSLSPPDWR